VADDLKEGLLKHFKVSGVSKSNKSDKAVAEKVYDQLAEDFPEDAIKWVKSAVWDGPVRVPLKEIDFSNKENWRASKDIKHVEHFLKKIEDEGFAKPIVLINEPNKKKLMVADGHHRALAYQKLKEAPLAFVATVGSENGPWVSMHDEQDENGEQYSRQNK